MIKTRPLPWSNTWDVLNQKKKRKEREKSIMMICWASSFATERWKDLQGCWWRWGFFLGFKLQIPTLQLKKNWQATVPWFFTLYFWSWNCPLHFSDNSLIEHLLCFSWGLMPGHWNKVEWDAVLYFSVFFPFV